MREAWSTLRTQPNVDYEWWYMKQIDLDKMKQIEIELLIEFISVCQKLHLNYLIAYGTLLGAVRHKGFIPWDDDIDIVMLRADYVTFLEKAPQYLHEPFFLQTHKTDPNYFNCFAGVIYL